MRSVKLGLMAAGVGMAVNVVLAIIKIVTGIIGNSYALVADGIESTTDIVSSLVVWTGLKISSIPADDDHPYGYEIAHKVSESLKSSSLSIEHVVVHVEPALPVDTQPTVSQR
jgi:divalent metal cation (Fe/Co/Zn/Cd) transporter